MHGVINSRALNKFFFFLLIRQNYKKAEYCPHETVVKHDLYIKHLSCIVHAGTILYASIVESTITVFNGTIVQYV
jgi:hypothetical protein